MATTTFTKKICDWDGVSEAHKTVHFSYEGKHYEMDLSVDAHNMVHGRMGEFIGKAREVKAPGRGAGRPRGRGVARPATATDKVRLNAIREWARANGYTVADRGRIPSHIEAAYDAKH